MTIAEITTVAGRNERRKRVGRGESSGMGKTCTRGNKGCQSRSGGRIRLTFIGGTTPLYRKFPKRGFSNFKFRTEYEVVNLADLEKFFDNGATVNRESLIAQHLICGAVPSLKVLGAGELKKKLNVTAHAFSDSAKAAIEKAGGKVEVIAGRDSAALAKAKRNSAKKARAAKRAK